MAREVLVDANILLRFLTSAPRDLADRAASLLEAAERRRIPLIVPPLILAEVVYVLERVYHWERRDIADRLLALVAAEVFTVLDGSSIAQALTWYRDIGGLHFADAHIAALARSRGGHVMSFDQRLARVPEIRLVLDPEDIGREN